MISLSHIYRDRILSRTTTNPLNLQKLLEIDFNGCRLPFLLRGSGTSANMSIKWQEDVPVIVHLKRVCFLR